MTVTYYWVERVTDKIKTCFRFTPKRSPHINDLTCKNRCSMEWKTRNKITLVT